MKKVLLLIFFGIFSVLLNATEIKIDADGDGVLDAISYHTLDNYGEPALELSITTKMGQKKIIYYYSTTDVKIDTCGKGCIIGIQVQGGNYGENLKEYFKYDKQRLDWFLEKRIRLIPVEIKDADKIIDIKRKEERIYYNESLTIDNRVIPKKSLKIFVEECKSMDEKLKNSLSEEYLAYYLTKYPLTNFNLVQYNNIAYYLEKANLYEESAYLLEKIIEKFPNRTVAYLNLGDAYWGLENKEKAKIAYQTYIKQMKALGKEKKIPAVVMERIKD